MKRRSKAEGPGLEPRMGVSFRKPWVMIATLIILILILAVLYHLA